jgi:hypothetical protein
VYNVSDNLVLPSTALELITVHWIIAVTTEKVVDSLIRILRHPNMINAKFGIYFSCFQI